MSKTLIFGYIGEFGWELIYNSLIRSLSKQFDRTIVVSRPLNEYIYSDFCSDFVSYVPKTNITNYATCKDELPIGFWERLIDQYCPQDEVHLIPFQTNLVHWSPSKGLFHYNDRFLRGCRHDWKKFGQPAEELKYDLLIHARHTSKLGSGKRNWGVNNWNELVHKLNGLKMACIGTQDASLSIDGADDLRGVGLKRVCDLMSSSKLIVGTSSGPMHLALLSGCKAVVITDKINYNRYHTHWNPLNENVLTIDRWSWHPTVDAVYGMLKLILANRPKAKPI